MLLLIAVDNELYRKQSKAEDILTTARNSWTEKSVSPRIM